MFDRIMYHTQEARRTKLYQPIKCIRNDAWLGYAWYFWRDEVDAANWGRDSKNKTGFYEIYSARITSDNILDTVFDENQYDFWVKSIEKALCDFYVKTKHEPEKDFIRDFIMNVAHWNTSLDGILFADSPTSVIPRINYRKRIQLALYNLNCLGAFQYYKKGRC